ncbi:MAG: ATPase [Candidatus Kerfeldbacteria bacterium RIFCSPHIGHO2_12_FULL_48_17]|uniref:ATPase n=1 Tax=Candidatus Kerfeldbacteria bacterium RIFCSPHIGHO2_12_FULL_48_17 TaxID=1798542 RepID=A0A1G2B0L2_9BACT|nr:MAG: ATPase [Candidatus Kerfeldbacteria bacterium RIFCSPHIGHO2_12_FULL_48_17]
MRISRDLQPIIEKHLFKKKVIIIYGARQVGKTTILKALEEKLASHTSRYLNCDEPDVRTALTDKTSTELKAYLGDANIIFLDEAQRVKNIGLTLKLLVDNFPEMQIIATGSSSFDLANQIVEPLTGRKYEFILYPFSLEELRQIQNIQEEKRTLEQRMIFGMYPEIVLKSSEAEELLRNITRSYLYKDILAFQNIRNPEVLDKLLQALALQIGKEVSYRELSNLLNIDQKTVANYIGILEKAFIVFTLKPYSRNIRNELKKLRKIYFYDLGIRNALINNLNPLSLREDVGGLWENFLLVERMKKLENTENSVNRYFWRTHQKAEIDYLEEKNGKLRAFEFKWGKKSARAPKAFSDAYQDAKFQVISKDNYEIFI